MSVWIGTVSTALREALAARFQGRTGTFYITSEQPVEPAALAELLTEHLFSRALRAAAEELQCPLDASRLKDRLREPLIALQTALTQEIRAHFAESDHLNVEGLLYFRLRHSLAAFYGNALQYASKSRLLDTLHEHLTAPQIDFLRVTRTQNDYPLFDRAGTPVHCVFSEPHSPEEQLIHSLLSLSPAALDLSALPQGTLKRVLEVIFAGRIV